MAKNQPIKSVQQEQNRANWQNYLELKNHLKAIKKAFDLNNESAVMQFILQIDGILENKP